MPVIFLVCNGQSPARRHIPVGSDRAVVARIDNRRPWLTYFLCDEDRCAEDILYGLRVLMTSNQIV